MRISDWSSDVCSSDLSGAVALAVGPCDAALGDDLVEQAAFGGSSFSLRCGFGFALGHACMPLVDDGCRSGSADGSKRRACDARSLFLVGCRQLLAQQIGRAHV